jgi:hypothetical protein
MKFILFLIIVLGVIGYISGPAVTIQKQCYDKTFTNTEELKTTAIARGWDTQKVCQDRFPMLSDLETCIRESTGSGTIAIVRTTLTNTLLQLVRPLTKPVLEQETQHNTDCAEFPKTRFNENQ